MNDLWYLILNSFIFVLLWKLFYFLGQWQPVLGFCQQGIIGSGISEVPIPRQCLFELPAVANGQIRYSTVSYAN